MHVTLFHSRAIFFTNQLSNIDFRLPLHIFLFNAAHHVLYNNARQNVPINPIFSIFGKQYPEKFDISEYILVNWETAHVATSDVHYHNYISKLLMVCSGYVLQLR